MRRRVRVLQMGLAVWLCGALACQTSVGDAREVPHDGHDAPDLGDAVEEVGFEVEVDTGDGADPAETVSPIDSDRDGIPDEVEVLDGTDPNDPASARAWHPERRTRPGVLVDTAARDVLRERLGSGDPGARAVWDRIVARAGATPPAPPDPMVWDDMVARERGQIAEAAAFVGWVTADEDMSGKAAALLAEPLASPWPLNEGLFATSLYDLHEAEALVAACHAFDLLAGTESAAPLLAQAEATLTGRVEDFAAIHLEPGAFMNFLLVAQNNHAMKVMGALGVCTLALPDRPNAAAQLNEAVSALTYLLLDFQGIPEGAYAEGWNYLAYGGDTWLALVWAWQRLVGDGRWPLIGRGIVTPGDARAGKLTEYGDLMREPTVMRIFENALRTSRPDGLMAPTDDANAVPLHGAILAALLDSPEWAWNWRRAELGFYGGSADVLTFIALGRVPAPAAPTWAPDHASRGAGFAVWRSDWGPEATYLLMLAEHGAMRTNGLGHEHADPLSLLMHAHGEALLLDPGYINFEHHDLVKRGEDHNIVLIDGEGPAFWVSIGPPAGDAFLEQWLVANGLSSALGSAQLGDVMWWRRVVRVEGRYFVVADRLIADGPHTYTLALHGHGGGDGLDGAFAMTGDGARWVRPKASLRAVVVPLEGQARYVERLDEHARGWGQIGWHSALDVHAEMDTSAGFLTVLWPGRAGENEPMISVSRAEGLVRVVIGESGASHELVLREDALEVRRTAMSDQRFELWLD